ncbi:AAA family ATPase [Acinetobacter sp.]|uniref:AAA family ATPase n=1 Tax=Acinetobacter sp. TaxID=472 RepID=UPI0037520599
MNPVESINQKNRGLTQFILAVAKGNFPSAAIIGPPGCGKTSLVHAILKEQKIEYASLALHNSPFALFNAICENPDLVILLDDIAVSKHPVINAILKAATGISENGIRLIEINTSDSVMKREKMQKRVCPFSGKLVFIANSEDLLKGHFSGAMASRMLTFNYDLTFNEKKYLINKFSEAPDRYNLSQSQMSELISHLNEFLTPACVDFDLRLFEKASAIVQTSPDDWKLGVNRLLDIDPVYSKLIQIISICDSLKQPKSKRSDLFSKVTGLSRSTYYDLCRKFGIDRKNDSFSVPYDDYLLTALTDLITNTNPSAINAKKVQKSSEITDHAQSPNDLDIMSNKVEQ